MKYPKILLFFILSFLFISCIHDDNYSNPSDPEYQNLIITTNIPDLHSRAGKNASEFTTDEITGGYIISSDQEGNIYGNIYMVTEDGKTGLQVSINQSNLYNTYPVGRKIYVKLKGLALVNQYSGMITLGTIPTGTYAVDQISPHIAASHIVVSPETKNEDLLTRKTNNSGNPLTLADLDASYLNTLVEVNNVEFENAGETFVRGNTNTDNKLVGSGIIARVSQYARFAGYTIPKGVGTVRGIFTKYSSTYQLLIRNIKDVKDFKSPIFLETFNNVDNILTRPKIDKATGFDNETPVTYNDPYGNADIRTSGTSFPSLMVWFPANKDASLVISHINTADQSGMTLSFGLNAGIFNATDKFYMDDLVVKCNDYAIALPHIELNTSNNKNKYYKVSVPIPDGTTKIEFYGSSSVNKYGLRIDDIKIEN